MAVRNVSLRIVFPLLALAALVGVAHWWLVGRFVQSTDDAYVRADMSVITPRVGGEIMAVHVADNQAVHKGDLLVEIDPRDYAARLANARAAVAAAQAAISANDAQLTLQQSTIEQARATLAAAQADQVRLEKDWKRAEQLVSDGVATHQRLDTALAAYKSGAANVARAVAGLKAARDQVAALQADGARLRSQLDAERAMSGLAQIDSDSTTLHAPIDGTVGDLAARVGERVAPGSRLLSLVPLQAVYVEANFKETQLTRMAVGQTAQVKIDAFPGRSVSGHIESFSPASGAEWSLLPAQNATGNFTKVVQRVPVRIALDIDPELRGRLRPGMSVIATVDTRIAVSAAPQ